MTLLELCEKSKLAGEIDACGIVRFLSGRSKQLSPEEIEMILELNEIDKIGYFSVPEIGGNYHRAYMFDGEREFKYIREIYTPMYWQHEYTGSMPYVDGIKQAVPVFRARVMGTMTYPTKQVEEWQLKIKSSQKQIDYIDAALNSKSVEDFTATVKALNLDKNTMLLIQKALSL